MFRARLNLVTGQTILAFAPTKAQLLKRVETEIHNGAVDGFNVSYKNTLFIFEVGSEESTKVLNSCFAYWSGKSFSVSDVINHSLIF